MSNIFNVVTMFAETLLLLICPLHYQLPHRVQTLYPLPQVKDRGGEGLPEGGGGWTADQVTVSAAVAHPVQVAAVWIAIWVVTKTNHP